MSIILLFLFSGPAGSPAEHQRQQQQQQSVAAVSSTSGVEEESDGRKPSKYGTIVDPELNSSLPPPVDDEDDQSRVSGLRESAPDIAKVRTFLHGQVDR